MNGEELFDRYGKDVFGPWEEQFPEIQQAWEYMAADVTRELDAARGVRRPFNVGDRYDTTPPANCPAEFRGEGGWLAFCVRDKGHDGQHVAADHDRIVEVWD